MSKSQQLERILKIDALVRQREGYTAERLAGELEVSGRTILSDVSFMRDRLGAPLAARGHRGWYYTDPNWRLPDIPLTQGELFALTLGARMLESYAGTTYGNLLQSAIERMVKRLPEGCAVNLQRLVGDRVYFRSGVEVRLDPEVWLGLLDAIDRSRQVWIRYQSPKGLSERTLDPYDIDVYRASNSYVWGYCHLRQEMRSFRIDRIRKLRILDATFARDPAFNLQKLLESGFQYEVGGKPVAIAIDFDAATAPYITERVWHHTQEIKHHDSGAITLQFTASGLNDVKRWVLGYGRGAIVRSPPELVKMMREETNAMMRQNESGEFE
ncbi:MAG: transcriptional regulator [Oscillatoriales cyanobacterium SM2_1_8]|nr:transcriptional regulator [Oscillatoriales cyanobacterium SM2_1_8]